MIGAKSFIFLLDEFFSSWSQGHGILGRLIMGPLLLLIRAVSVRAAILGLLGRCARGLIPLTALKICVRRFGGNRPHTDNVSLDFLRGVRLQA